MPARVKRQDERWPFAISVPDIAPLQQSEQNRVQVAPFFGQSIFEPVPMRRVRTGNDAALRLQAFKPVHENIAGHQCIALDFVKARNAGETSADH